MSGACGVHSCPVAGGLRLSDWGKLAGLDWDSSVCWTQKCAEKCHHHYRTCNLFNGLDSSIVTWIKLQFLDKLLHVTSH